MSNVYFRPVPEGASAAEIQQISRELLQTIIEKEAVALEPEIPLKLHFGERGNRTFLKPEIYDGVIDFLQEKKIKTCYVETSVLYGGERFNREKHLKLAKDHGFTRLPIVIADGAKGEESTEVPVNLKYFKSASVARALAKAPQVLVCAHFKGHILAGFGGAIKQLSMGFAAKGGKLAMHMGVKPRIINFLCKHCGLCEKRCNAGAINTKGKSYIDHEKCIGCGACFSICPHHAVSIFSFAGFRNALFKGKFFREKLVEYAYAAHHGKHHIYLNFMINVTKGCDCEPRPMHNCIPDVGIFASMDPVAIDTACIDACEKRGLKFKGTEQLVYAEKIGLGSRSYTLITE